jgi:hypothetical protein
VSVAVLLALTQSAASGCGEGWDSSLGTDRNDLAADVTGYGPGPAGDPTYNYNQAEAVISVNGGGEGIITVTYNDNTDTAADLFQYTETTRTVLHGASLMGWSNSYDGGVSYTYSGKVNPPSGWAILWGDPSIASWSQNLDYVFIANLGISENMVPPGGSMIGAASDYIDGGCIARSTNGGVTFAAPQCVSDEGHFYDGSSLSIDTNGSVWAAFRDVDSNQIDVWRATSVTGTFTLFANPFPGKTMVSHPRLRSFGTLTYVMAQDSSLRLWIARRSGSGWGTPVSPPTQFTPSGPLNLDMSGGEVLRTAYQFAFDVANTQVTTGIGSPCPCTDSMLYCKAGQCLPRDNIRIIYAGGNAGGTDIYMSTCSQALDSCTTVPNWSTHIGTARAGHQFNPVIHAFPGFLSIPPSWRAAWLSREHAPTGGTVQLREANVMLFLGVPAFAENPLIAAHDVCADDRGYWGDYNDIKFIEPPPTDEFITVRTDSSLGCSQQWEWTSHHAHVESVRF